MRAISWLAIQAGVYTDDADEVVIARAIWTLWEGWAACSLPGIGRVRA